MVVLVVVAGKDKSVVLWSIHDHISTLATDSNGGKSPKDGDDNKPTESPKVQARGIFQGHQDTVEDVQFCPSRYLTRFTLNHLQVKILTHCFMYGFIGFCFSPNGSSG